MATIKLNDLTTEKKETKETKNEIQTRITSKVIKGTAETRKPSLLSKFKQTFFADDIQSVKTYAVKDVIIPGIKHLFLDSLSMLILGERCYSSSPKRNISSSYSYNTVYKSKEDRERNRRYSEAENEAVNYNEIILNSRGDVDDALYTMNECIAVYGNASVADLYIAVGAPYTSADYNYGWNKESFSRATFRRVSGGGYLLDLPRPHPID